MSGCVGVCSCWGGGGGGSRGQGQEVCVITTINICRITFTIFYCPMVRLELKAH